MFSGPEAVLYGIALSDCLLADVDFSFKADPLEGQPCQRIERGWWTKIRSFATLEDDVTGSRGWREVEVFGHKKESSARAGRAADWEAIIANKKKAAEAAFSQT